MLAASDFIHSYMTDRLDNSSGSMSPTVCVELKPKCGFLPTSPCILPAHSIKRSVPRFQLHQHLKLAQVSHSSHNIPNSNTTSPIIRSSHLANSVT